MISTVLALGAAAVTLGREVLSGIGDRGQGRSRVGPVAVGSLATTLRGGRVVR